MNITKISTRREKVKKYKINYKSVNLALEKTIIEKTRQDQTELTKNNKEISYSIL